MRRQQFLVIGLGVFGETIATELTRLGNEVLGVDRDERQVDRLAESITHAVVADVTDERTLKELNVEHYDAAVVAIGRDVEASILATMQLCAMGIEEVWAKALSPQHHRILAKLGANRIVHPEYEMGLRVAQALNYPMVNNYMDLGNDEFLVELIATERLDNRQMHEIIDGAGADVNILLLRRQDKCYQRPKFTPEDMVIASGDHIILQGKRSELQKIAREL
ncbi:TrkA family potassium uptake protein [Proteobacteria bacterium 005FR1]|nr:TrkA family potassium uptake protein [Proteobacteria bacterium 005FR1]